MTIVWGTLAAGGLLFPFTRLLIETEPASRPLLWLNASLLVSSILVWFGLQGGRSWVRHFAFPVAFLFLSVPWIFPLERLIVQELMTFNAAAVAGTLALFDIPARAAGHTIILATGQLGVTEACCGIRSLQASLMLSLFFGEFYRWNAPGRIALPLLGAGIALLGNYARMLFLAWRGFRDGTASVEQIHDSTGILILTVTIVSLWVVGLIFQRSEPIRVSSNASRSPLLTRRHLAATWAIGVLVMVIGSEMLTEGWYSWREQTAVHFSKWTVAWPIDAAAFRRLSISSTSREQLHFAAANGAEWRDDVGCNWSGLWFQYHSAAEDKVVFEAHNPELCLPAAGWTRLADASHFETTRGTVYLNVSAYHFAAGSANPFVFWIPYIDRGSLSQADQARGLYGHSLAGMMQLQFPWLWDVWTGCRGADVETLELAVTGPATLAEAEQGFRREVVKLIIPDTPATLAVQTR